MPQTRQQHGVDQCRQRPGHPLAHQRHVHVVTQKMRQGHVPTCPELGDALRDIRLVEVLRETEAHHQRQAQGHVAVTGEVEVQLQGRHHQAEPGIAELQGAFADEQRVDRRQLVGDQYFHDETEHEATHPQGEQLQGVGALAQLRGQLAVAQDRPGDQVREQRDEGGKVDEVVRRRRVLAVDVDDVAQGMEHIEGDAQRQEDGLQAPGVDTQRREQGGEHFGAEVGVLEVAQGRQVADDADPQQAQGPAFVAGVQARLDAQAEPVVPVGDGDEQQQKVRPPPGIEDVAGSNDHGRAPLWPGEEVHGQEQRQVEE
ncbi:hypothetical protein D3C78_1113180 [compost metagenome]